MKPFHFSFSKKFGFICRSIGLSMLKHNLLMILSALYFICVCFFYAGPCCPSGVKLYRTTDNSFQVYWRSTGSQHSIIAELLGSNNSYNCTALPGQNSCSIDNIQCGDVFHVIVAPLTVEGEKILFCPQRLYSGNAEQSWDYH